MILITVTNKQYPEYKATRVVEHFNAFAIASAIRELEDNTPIGKLPEVIQYGYKVEKRELES